MVAISSPVYGWMVDITGWMDGKHNWMVDITGWMDGRHNWMDRWMSRHNQVARYRHNWVDRYRHNWMDGWIT